jgi:carboxyl-terminal processing protease
MPKTNSDTHNKIKKEHIVKSSAENSAAKDYYSSPASDKKIQLTSTIIACFVTLVVGFAVGANWSSIKTKIGVEPRTDVSKINFDSLNEVYQTLAEDYDGDLDKQAVIDEAKRGLVNAAGDKYTYFMTKAEADEFNKELEGDVGAGIGVEIGERDGWVKVLRTTDGNPAQKAGVLAGDIIYKADDEDISTLGVDKVAEHLRGAEGTKVKLTVVRDGEEKEFELIREKINNASVYVSYRQGGKTAVLTISRFDSDTGNLARDKANEIIAKGCTKVILDLRGNGGGYVSAAQDVASLWIDGDLVVEQRSKSGLNNDKIYAKTGRAVFKDMNTVILMNSSSASASEIVIGALKDYGKATLIGEKSYGKGSVQALEDLNDGSVLRVTVAKWYTPNGYNINEEGIEPDKAVERTFEQINHNEDPQLDAALAF